MNATIWLRACLFFTLLFMIKSEFFLKTSQPSKNIPRMGRRDQNLMPNLIHRVAKTLEVLMEIVEDYDSDANGELSPEELMSVPFIQNAIKHYIEARELQEVTREQEATHQTIEQEKRHLKII